MSRDTTLAVGIALTAATIVLLVFAAKRIVYFFSFETAPPPAAVESNSAADARPQFNGIALTWDTVPKALSYNLYWSTRPGVTRQTGKKIAGIQPPYRFVRVEKGQVYYFVVTAVTDAGESGESEEIVYRAVP